MILALTRAVYTLKRLRYKQGPPSIVVIMQCHPEKMRVLAMDENFTKRVHRLHREVHQYSPVQFSMCRARWR